MHLYAAITNGSAPSGGVTITYPSNIDIIEWAIDEVANVNLASPIAQVATDSDNCCPGAGVDWQSLSSFESSDNGTIGFFGNFDAPATFGTAEGGYTELGETEFHSHSIYTTMGGEWRPDPDTSVTFSWSAQVYNRHSIALEIRAGDPFDPTNPANDPGHPTEDTKDPVNTITGDFAHNHTDIFIPGKGVPLQFTRYYHSRSTTDRTLGPGWTHSYDMYLVFDGDNVTVFYPDGHANLFQLSGSDYVARSGVQDVLTEDAGDFTLVTINQVTYSFDGGDGSLVSIVDRNGNTTELDYVGGLLDTVTDAGGRTLTFDYDAGSLETVTDPISRTVEFTYDMDGNLDTVEDVKGGITDYDYGSTGMELLTDANNHEAVANLYDSDGRVVEQTDAFGGITCIYYGTAPSHTSTPCPGVSPTPDTDQTVVVDPRGLKTTYEFDTNFRTTSITDDDGGVTSFGFDSDHNRICITDPLGNKTGLDYDSEGNVIEMVDAENTDGSCALAGGGVSWTFTYTASNDPETVTDPLGRETEYIYDATGNLTRIVRMDDSSNILLLTCFELDGDGLVTAVVESTDLQLPGEADDPCTGHETAFEYNTSGNLVSITDPRFVGQMSPPQTILDPDAAGRVESVTDELSHATAAVYDAFNMPLSVTDELGNTTSWTYDAKGNVETVTDANRQAVSTPESGADCGTAGTGDGDDDDSDTVVDDGCPNFIYVYDEGDRLVEVIDALGNSTTYSYDENSNLVAITKANRQAVGTAETGAACANNTGDGDDDDSDTIIDDGCPSTIYAYDDLNRLVSAVDALGRETTYDYDDASNLIERVDARGLITEYTPDELNRLVAIEYWDASHMTMASSVDYDYDEVGNRIEMVDATGTTTYVPDPLNRLESVTFPGSITVSYEYDELGDRTKITYPSTDDVDYTYDEGHRMETVTDWLSNQTVYTYDGAGRLDLAELANGVDVDYDYDDANRLTDVTNTGPGPTTISDYHYELDAVGNRIEMTDLSGTHEYVYDALYRMTEVTYPDPETDSYTYDDDGNRLTKDGDDYTYDAADQLTDLEGVTYDYDENGNQVERDTDTFAYDHENRLGEAVINSVTSTSEYNGDGLRMSLTVDNGSPVTTDYTWDVNRGLPVILDDGINQQVYGLDLIAVIDGSSNDTYFTYDGLGSVTALADDAGAATDTYSYDVFGAIRASGGSTPNNWLFTGEQYDEDSGLYYLRSRSYDADTGRFLSVDPIMAAEPYAYVSNNPANFVDPMGLCRVEVRAKKLLGLTGYDTFYHLFIYTYDPTDGTAVAYRGGPDYQPIFDLSGVFQNPSIIAEHDEWGTNFPDYSSTRDDPTEVVMDDKGSCDTIRSNFNAKEAVINNSEIPYKLLGKNSNWTVRQLLSAAGLPERLPETGFKCLKGFNVGLTTIRYIGNCTKSVWAPGW